MRRRDCHLVIDSESSRGHSCVARGRWPFPPSSLRILLACPPPQKRADGSHMVSMDDKHLGTHLQLLLQGVCSFVLHTNTLPTNTLCSARSRGGVSLTEAFSSQLCETRRARLCTQYRWKCPEIKLAARSSSQNAMSVPSIESLRRPKRCMHLEKRTAGSQPAAGGAASRQQ